MIKWTAAGKERSARGDFDGSPFLEDEPERHKNGPDESTPRPFLYACRPSGGRTFEGSAAATCSNAAASILSYLR